MTVRVDKARYEGTSLQIHQACIGSLTLEDFFVRAHGQDLITLDGNRLSDRLMRIHRQDHAVGKDRFPPHHLALTRSEGAWRFQELGMEIKSGQVSTHRQPTVDRMPAR